MSAADALPASPAEIYRLWPDPAPNPPPVLPNPVYVVIPGEGASPQLVQGIAEPHFYVFRAVQAKRPAVLIIPGGGYGSLALQGEGLAVAERLRKAGISCFVLIHRLPTEGWGVRASVPLQDAQRAMRVIRALADHFAIDPACLGVLGFSAGGHLAATLATRHDESCYTSRDQADTLSARPAFAGLIYPVIRLRPPAANLPTRFGLMGPTPSEAELDARSPAQCVTADTPPSFLVHALDDTVVPPDNALDMLTALRDRAVAVESHFFQSGGHGFGLGGDTAAAPWPDLFLRWLAEGVGQAVPFPSKVGYGEAEISSDRNPGST